MRIRTLEPHEFILHRNLRLSALRDSPDSFGEVAAEVEARPLSYWEELTRSVTEPNRHVMFLACDCDVVCGSTYGLRDRKHESAGRVGGTWVAATYRRQGVGHSLLLAVLDWSQGQGFKCLRLWAPSENVAALALYRRTGFTSTGHRRPMSSSTDRRIEELKCTLPVRAR